MVGWSAPPSLASSHAWPNSPASWGRFLCLRVSYFSEASRVCCSYIHCRAAPSVARPRIDLNCWTASSRRKPSAPKLPSRSRVKRYSHGIAAVSQEPTVGIAQNLQRIFGPHPGPWIKRSAASNRSSGSVVPHHGQTSFPGTLDADGAGSPNCRWQDARTPGRGKHCWTSRRATRNSCSGLRVSCLPVRAKSCALQLPTSKPRRAGLQTLHHRSLGAGVASRPNRLGRHANSLGNDLLHRGPRNIQRLASSRWMVAFGDG